MTLSSTMIEAFDLVPQNWQPLPYRTLQVNGRRVRSVRYHPTFEALKKRNMLEFRGGPGTWEWRRAPAAPKVMNADS